MLRLRGYITGLLVLLTILGQAQNFNFSGRIIDADSREPLAFVNVSYNGVQGQSDIEGRLNLTSGYQIGRINLSYVGYLPLTFINPDSILKNSGTQIKLHRSVTNLTAVVIKGGENPAHRIIKKVTSNRKL